MIVDQSNAESDIKVVRNAHDVRVVKEEVSRNDHDVKAVKKDTIENKNMIEDEPSDDVKDIQEDACSRYVPGGIYDSWLGIAPAFITKR